MKNLSSLTILCIICLGVFCAETKHQLKTDQEFTDQPRPQQKQLIIQTPTQNKQQSKFDLKDTFSKLDIPKPDINIDFKGATDTIKEKLPDITIQIPKIDINPQQIKGTLIWLKDKSLEMLAYIGVGVLCGVLFPIVLFLVLLVLGFGVAGIRAGSLAACCQSPSVVAGGCFSSLQKFGATARLLVIIPKTSIIGGIAGLLFFIYCKATNLNPTIDTESLLQTLNTTKDQTLAALLDIGKGIIFGVLVPVAAFLFAVGGECIVNSFNICCASPTSILDVIKIIRKLRTCILLIPNAGILGAFGGLGYYVLAG